MDLSVRPDSCRYKTKAFIAEGKLHFLLFKVNNLSNLAHNYERNRGLEQGIKRRGGVEPLNSFLAGRRLLSVFLNSSEEIMNFQELEQSRYASSDTSMDPMILRCFKDMVAVLYRVGDKKTVILYEIQEEEYLEVEINDEERMFIPEYKNADRKKRRERLDQILEVDQSIMTDSTLHDMFFLERDTLCLMVGSDMVICRIFHPGLKNPTNEDKCKAEYLRVKIHGFDDKNLKVRKFQLDRVKNRRYYFHGKTIWRLQSAQRAKMMISYGEKMVAAGSIDLRGLKDKLSELETGEDLSFQEPEDSWSESSSHLEESLVGDER